MTKVYADIVDTPRDAKCDNCGAPAVISYQSETDEGHADVMHLCDDCEDERIDRMRI